MKLKTNKRIKKKNYYLDWRLGWLGGCSVEWKKFLFILFLFCTKKQQQDQNKIT